MNFIELVAFIAETENPLVLLPEGRHSDSMDSLISPSENYAVDDKKMTRHRPNDDGESNFLFNA